MNYFKVLGIAFGIVALLKPVYMHILPYDEFSVIGKVYDQKRPKWVMYVALFGVMLVAFTWYKYFTTNIKYSVVIAVLFSLTLIKAIALLFNYEAFQKWVTSMLAKEKNYKIILVDIVASVFGLVLIVASIRLL